MKTSANAGLTTALQSTLQNTLLICLSRDSMSRRLFTAKMVLATVVGFACVWQGFYCPLPDGLADTNAEYLVLSIGVMGAVLLMGVALLLVSGAFSADIWQKAVELRSTGLHLKESKPTVSL